MVTSLFCQMTCGLGAADQERRHRHAGAEPVDRGCGPAYEPPNRGARCLPQRRRRGSPALGDHQRQAIQQQFHRTRVRRPGQGPGRAADLRQRHQEAIRHRSRAKAEHGPQRLPLRHRRRARSPKADDAKIRQAIAHDALAGLSHIGHPNSYFTWLPLPEDARADRIAATLSRNHISVSTAEPFTTTTHTPQAIRPALGSADLATLPATLRTLARTIELDGFQ
jgi:hypothetical protein